MEGEKSDPTEKLLFFANALNAVTHPERRLRYSDNTEPVSFEGWVNPWTVLKRDNRTPPQIQELELVIAGMGMIGMSRAYPPYDQDK